MSITRKQLNPSKTH